MFRLFVAFLLLSVATQAQNNFVVTSKLDTIFGKPRILSYDLIDRVQIEVNKKKESFTALQVLSVTIDSQVYKPVRYEKKIFLMKLLKSGYLSLYAFPIDSRINFDGRFLTKLDGTSMEVPNLSFKKFMGNYLNDCSTIVSKIKSGDLSKKDLYKIIDEYNICIIDANKDKMIPSSEVNEKSVAITNLIGRIEAEDFTSKKDALDLLKDIQNKVSNNEPVPNYLTDGLKSYLAGTPALTEDLNALLTLLQK